MPVDSYLPGRRPHSERHLHRLSWPLGKRTADRFGSHLREQGLRKASGEEAGLDRHGE